VSLGLGVLGCGSVFAGPYRGMIERLRTAGRVHVAAVFDLDSQKRHGAAAHYDVDPDLAGAEALIGGDDVDVVLVLTSMNEHGPLAAQALAAGKHVLVEKPMATSLEEAAALTELSRKGPGLLVCAPHILLSPTYRAVHASVRSGAVGEVLTARARYGWASTT
jgi:predicted dehydrogenase